MMGCAGQAERMSLYEYEERLYHWNEAHGGDDNDLDVPDPEHVLRSIEAANANPLLTN